MPRGGKRQTTVVLNPKFTKEVRRIADARATAEGLIGIRLLQNYHCLVRAHAISFKRATVTRDDMDFLRAIDAFVSTRKCLALNGEQP